MPSQIVEDWLIGRARRLAPLAAGAAVALSACGGSAPKPVATAAPVARSATLDTQRVARAIGESIRVQRGIRAEVACPAGIGRKTGAEFNCLATIKVKGKAKTAVFVVTQKKDGFVSYAAK